MIHIEIKELLDIAKGNPINVKEMIPFKKVSIDSRDVDETTYFIPVLGEVHDGHKFILGALDNGAPVSFCEKAYFYSHYEQLKDRPLILVDNTTTMLHRLTTYILKKTGVKIIGITGSVGKTSTKEFIYHVLEKSYSVHKNKGNFNNHIGLPLTVFDLEAQHEIAILEMGMNHFKEIETLVNMANPDIAVVTNIGTSHIGILGSRENIFQAKMEITSHLTGSLILNGSDEFLKTVNSNEFEVVKTGLDLIYENEVKRLDGCYSYDLILDNKRYTINLNVLGKHNIVNSLLAVGVGLKLQVPVQVIIEGIESFKDNEKRLEVLGMIGDGTLINDCYNASQESIISALEVLGGYSGYRIAVIGDVLELGEFSKESHEAIGLYLKDHPIDELITYGNDSEYILKKSNNKGQHFTAQEALIEYLLDKVDHDSVCLVKGSLGMGMKKIVDSMKK